MRRTLRRFRAQSVSVLLCLSLTTTLAVVAPPYTAQAQAAGAKPKPLKPAKERDAHAVPAKPIAAPMKSLAMQKAEAASEAAAKRPVIWPAPGERTLTVEPSVTPATKPTISSDGFVSARSTGAGPKIAVTLNVQDQGVSKRAGIDGVLVTAKTPAARADVQLSFDYSDYVNAFGADWAARLTVVSLPECALTTPNVPVCSEATPLQSKNDTAAKKVTTTAPVSSQRSVLAITAGSESSTGSYAASPLSAASSWSGGGSSGDFTWSYPLRVPPAAAGPTPSLAFSYSAQSVDGRTSATNNQVSWIGEGFDLTDSYVERKYGSCDQDGQAGKFDLCWRYDNATLTLNGKSNELVRASGVTIGASTWKLKNDDGSKVEKVVGTFANGDANKEYWRVTTTDGTQYYFGLTKLPTYADGILTNSVFTVPVAGDDAAEPCHNTTFATSFCDIGWRWNLDYVVDLHGNAMSYWYTKETNNYAKNGVASPGTPYVRAGYLNRIDYGQRSTALNTTPFQRVEFITADRCLTDCGTAAGWPDTPSDQMCTGTTACTNKVSPTFFTRKRLTQIRTLVWNGTTYLPVDSWQTTQSFPAPGDGSTGAPMWLGAISHNGLAGSTLTVPNVTFTGNQLVNRVDSNTDGLNGLVRYRIGEIRTETGAHITVNYSPKDCVAGAAKPAKDSNTRRCYPVKWTPPREVERTDWFHKYVVDNVVTTDSTGNGATMVTQYVYSGGAAWHYQETALVKDEDKTWSDWRGYGTVTTYTGDPANPGPRSKTVTRYFRGMDGDRLDTTPVRYKNVEVADSEGTVRADAPALAGSPREQITYQEANSTSEVSGTITDYVLSEKATQVVPWGTLRSNFVGASSVTNRTARDGGRPDLVSRVTTQFDPDNGLPNRVNDEGDLAKVDETCTITNYAKKSATWQVALPIRIVTSTGACDSASANPPESRALSDVRTFYDGLATYGTVGLGDATTVQRMQRYSGATPVYQTSGTKTYDALGRVTSTGDALGRITKTAYTPVATGPLTQTVVTPPKVTVADGTTPDFNTTTTYRIEWGLPSKTTDPNGKVTEMAYDALGRLTSVWLPSQSPASSKLANTKYTYTLSQTAASTIRTDQLNVDATGYVTSYAQFDSLLRPRQTQSPGVNSGRVITESRYDSRGQVIYDNKDIWDSSAPSATFAQVLNNSAPSQNFNEYDGAGRIVKSTFMVNQQPKWSTTTQYGGDTTTVLPPAGGSATANVIDARGHVIERREYNGNTATGTPDLTKYTYDLAGRMTKMEGSGGVWTNTYDLRGRKIQSTDPDSGTSTSVYDEGDRLVSTTDSTNTTVVNTYDALDRKTGLYKTSVDPANLLSDWTYDNPGLLGQLAASTSYTAGKTGPAYRTLIERDNALYNPTKVTRQIPSAEGSELVGSYAEVYSYKADQKTLSMTNDSGGGGLGPDPVNLVYNGVGLPTRAYSTRLNYVNDVDYNELGDATFYDLGSKSDMNIVNLYEDGTRRLSRSQAGKSTIFADHLYTYDPVGNVTKDQNLVNGGDTQCFDYDGHSRLTNAWTPAAADCADTPSASSLGGAAPYWQSWTYTATGLRQTQVDHSTAGDLTSTYTYNTSQPHTLAKVTQAGAGAGPEKSFGYDSRGNTTARPDQTLAWNAQGKLSQLTGATGDTEYVYDADGALLVRRGPSETTVFLGPIELTLNKATRKVLGKRQYQFNGQTIAVRSANGTAEADVSWLVTDYHGTSQVAVDAGSLDATVRYAKPFGDPRGTASQSWPDNHGFLGKPEDTNTGLTTVGAREYDPLIGRFLSVDPLLNPDDPQQMLGYTYANDNPVSDSDPTGLMSDTVGDSGGSSGTRDPSFDVDKDGDKIPDGYLGGTNNSPEKHHKGGLGSKFGGWVKKKVNDVEDTVDKAREWASDHAEVIGAVVAVVAGALAVAAFCGATAGIGCLIVAGAIAGASGYGTRVGLGNDGETFSATGLAQETLNGAAAGAVSAGIGGALSKALVGKITTQAAAKRTADTGETFYRTMSDAHFGRLAATGRVPASGETFISPSRAYSEGYNGALVQLNVRSGTSAALARVGVSDGTDSITRTYPSMPLVSSGWNRTSALFKSERGLTNIGLGRGTALDIFNNNLVGFERLR
jgi:RHS repeat-associated protein